MTSNFLTMVLPDSATPSYLGVIPLLCSGFASAVIGVSFWVIFPRVFAKKLLGTGYGICYTIWCVIAAFIPNLGDYIHDRTIDTHFGFFWVITIIAQTYHLVVFLLVRAWNSGTCAYGPVLDIEHSQILRETECGVWRMKRKITNRERAMLRKKKWMRSKRTRITRGIPSGLID